MTVMTPCDPNSPLMKAWDAYQKTDDFKNSFAWVTVNQRPRDTATLAPGANPKLSNEHYNGRR